MAETGEAQEARELCNQVQALPTAGYPVSSKMESVDRQVFEFYKCVVSHSYLLSLRCVHVQAQVHTHVHTHAHI